MPISKKITDEIESSVSKTRLKQLMKDILALEDKGTTKWTKEYEQIIDKYVKNK